MTPIHWLLATFVCGLVGFSLSRRIPGGLAFPCSLIATALLLALLLPNWRPQQTLPDRMMIFWTPAFALLVCLFTRLSCARWDPEEPLVARVFGGRRGWFLTLLLRKKKLWVPLLLVAVVSKLVYAWGEDYPAGQEMDEECIVCGLRCHQRRWLGECRYEFHTSEGSLWYEERISKSHVHLWQSIGGSVVTNVWGGQIEIGCFGYHSPPMADAQFARVLRRLRSLGLDLTLHVRAVHHDYEYRQALRKAVRDFSLDWNDDEILVWWRGLPEP